MEDLQQYELYPKLSFIRDDITNNYRADEEKLVNNLINEIYQDKDSELQIKQLASDLIVKVRSEKKSLNAVMHLMHEFSLDSQEGIALMCLAESLLRIPDKETIDKLIKDKISKGDWRSYTKGKSLFVNATTWGLIISRKIYTSYREKSLSAALNSLISKGGEPLIRKGIDVAMKILGSQFVSGETIENAYLNCKNNFLPGYNFSFDMLGEAAFTRKDADKYYKDYVNAIHAIGKYSQGQGVYKSSGISVKLSAIHPRYSVSQYNMVINELYPRLKHLFLLAKKYDIGLNIDAEEADRLELSLDLLDMLLKDEDLKDYLGIGFVVQAYQKRSFFVIDYLIKKTREFNRKIMVRLVKGAYWDYEIKKAQMEGLESYPVFTRKVHTDICYQACANKLLSAQDVIYPQFATHNARTLAYIYHIAKEKQFEFQCLFGMGEPLYNGVVGASNLNIPCRVYAPVGSHKTLLAYLVRRLLENGANSSFVNKILDESVSIEDLVANPIDIAMKTKGTMHDKLPLPSKIYKNNRINSKGLDVSNLITLKDVEKELNSISKQAKYIAKPQLGKEKITHNNAREIFNPANLKEKVGEVFDADIKDISIALDIANIAKDKWAKVSSIKRASYVENFANLLEEQQLKFIDLAIREAGKTLVNAVAEIREAVDFCRYYAGEIKSDKQEFDARGIIVAISPWNFPLAIFIGEVVSALVAGNVVIAKPAEQTPLIAYEAVNLLYEAGVPKDVLLYLPGDGALVGAKLVEDERIAGVIFTGSTATAKNINQNIAKHQGIKTLIAETGGQNALIVDSSALAEQVVVDVIASAFDSAGQRCSALRVLYLQKDIASHFLEMLKGAMAELVIGDTRKLSTDIGPVIDKESQDNLLNHIRKLKKDALSFYQLPLSIENINNGYFVPPTLIQINSIHELTKEVFGPILHVIIYDANNFDKIIEDINYTGFGLTSGIHTRIDEVVEDWANKINAGNLYVNRNIIGAVVGVQPFGGVGLSGTGPKAGGPFYLQRLQKRLWWHLNENLSIYNNDIIVNINKFKQSLLKILNGHQLQDLYDFIDSKVVNSLYNKNVYLQGITGEDNILRFTNKRIIGIGFGDLYAQFQALAAIVISGSIAVVEKNSPIAKYQLELDQFLLVVDDFNLEEKLANLIVIDELSLDKKIHYAKKEGAILTYIENLPLALSLYPLVQEKSISINTAAAGGNATLMADID